MSDLQQNMASLGRIQIMNENWRGKTDPAERRRIQNRLNQRAFRERQRTTASSSTDSDPDSAPSSPQPQTARSAPTTSLDELGQTINHNVLQAIISNASYLSIPLSTLRSATPVLTPQTSCSVASLTSTKLQHIIPHDPFIDAIPHPRFRLNYMQALASKRLDAARLGASLRRSGMPVGRGVREGLIVWGEPTEWKNWELSENFVDACEGAGLLEGCEEWIEATNWWRGQRGEGELRVD